MQELQVYENNYLEHIKQADLLPQELLEKVQNLLPELNHVVETQTIWRTETEIRCSVLNNKDFPDRASKYHQAKLEQMVFFDQLLHLSFAYKKQQQQLFIKEAEIEELEYQLADIELLPFAAKKLSAEQEIKKIELEEITFALKNMQIQGRERVRELEIWSKIKEELDDGSFDINKKDNSQLISLTRRYIHEAWYMATSGNPSADVSSVNNIRAQFETLVMWADSNGLMPEVLSVFGPDIREWVSRYFNKQ